jgi:hypothetical protein
LNLCSGNNTYDTLPHTGTQRSNRSTHSHHQHQCAGHLHVHGEEQVHVHGHAHTTTPCLVHHGLYHRTSQESKTDSNLSQVEI